MDYELFTKFFYADYFTVFTVHLAESGYVYRF